MSLTVAQAALFLGVKPGTIRAWIHQRKIERKPDSTLDVTQLLAAAAARNTRMVQLVDRRWAPV